MTSAIVVSLVSLFAAQPKGHSLRAWSVRVQFISSSLFNFGLQNATVALPRGTLRGSQLNRMPIVTGTTFVAIVELNAW